MGKTSTKQKIAATELNAIIRKCAIINAMQYGKAVSSAVMGPVVQMAKENNLPITDIKKDVDLMVKNINKMTKTDLEGAYAPFKTEVEQKKLKKAKETALPNMILEGVTKGNFIGRIPPEPSGYLHVGHAKQAILNAEFAKIYAGQVNLFIDDTNPDKEKQEYVDSIIRDIKWLGINYTKIYYASDNVEVVYAYARKLIEKGKAYVCMCEQAEIKERRVSGADCKHKGQSISENNVLFEDMVNKKFKEGKAILRYKGDMNSQNAVMRDPVLVRIIEAPHYRQGNKYRAWPLYDLSTPILDSLNGVTDIIRSKEFAMREELGQTLLNELGLRVPRMHQEARLNIRGNVTQKRVITKLVTDKVIDGWDDPRLMTLMALKRRGVRPNAIWAFVLKFGMSRNDGTVGLEMLMAENKKIIEPMAKHLFFVKDPRPLEIVNLTQKIVKLKLNPNSDKDHREYTVGSKLYISEDDAVKLKVGSIVRLKDLVDVKILNVSEQGLVGETIDQEIDKKDNIIQWVSSENMQKCKMLVPNTLVNNKGEVLPNSLTIWVGFVESYVNNLKEHEIIQFERVGYVILDKKDSLQFIFISK
ncbi:Glutamate--tRNA ligase [uncultured archaeon]|nr:Glutamate--tRNA ligase [uncultured archaeon]